MIKGTISKNGVTVAVEAENAQDLAALINGTLGSQPSTPANVQSATKALKVTRKEPKAHTRTSRKGMKYKWNGYWTPNDVAIVASIIKETVDPAHPNFQQSATKLVKNALRQRGDIKTRTGNTLATFVSEARAYVVEGNSKWLSTRAKNMLDEAGYGPKPATNYLDPNPQPVEA